MIVQKFNKIIKTILDDPELNSRLVGGVVRDTLLGLKIKDVDIVISGKGKDKTALLNRICEIINQIDLKTEFQDRIKDYNTFKFSFVDLDDSKKDLDFVFSRKETYSHPAAKPIIEDGSLEDDLFRRDFSINALASQDISCDTESIIDLYGGRADLKLRNLKVLHDKSFIDDPIRIIRGYRFKLRFNFEFDKHTFELMSQAISDCILTNCSEGRRYFEFLKIFEEPNTFKILNALIENKILNQLLLNTIDSSDFNFDDKLDHADLNFLNKLNAFLDVMGKDREQIVKKLPLNRESKKLLVNKT